MARSALVGRDTQLGALDALVRELPRHGAALVLRGDPGVGKSSLLGVAAGAALDAGYAVLDVTGVESEMQVPFSGLHRLLGPILAAASALPPRQREALRAAFGAAGTAVEPGDAGYAAVRSTYMRGGRPGLVLRPGSTAEVVEALAYARSQDVPLAIRSGGHGISGRSTNEGGIVLDLSRMAAI